jgi:hypothetical protein
MINGTQAVEYTTYIGRVAAPSRLVYYLELVELEVVDSLAAIRGLEGGGGNLWDLPKAAATRSRGERVQLDIQRADVYYLISWMLPLRGADAAGDQESPERSSTL